MKAIFNLGQTNEVTLDFDQIAENYFAPNGNVVNTLTLDFRKYDLPPEQSMVDYCSPVMGADFIQTIHCYNTTEIPSEKNLSMIFNRYRKISACKTILDGTKTLEDNSSDINAKTGILTLIQG